MATEQEETVAAPVAAVGKVRLTETPPVRCSSCFGQYPDRRHVDFGAAWDGPTVAPDPGVVGGKAQAIDDLIICDECVTVAAGLLGLEDPGDTRRHVAEVEAQADELRERLHGAMDLVAKLEEAAAARATLEARLTGGGG